MKILVVLNDGKQFHTSFKYDDFSQLREWFISSKQDDILASDDLIVRIGDIKYISKLK